MTKGNTQNLAAMLEAAYPVASNTKNTYARNYMLKTLVDQAHWPMNTKLGDAADKTSQVQAYLGETVATESEVSGKVVMMQGSKAAGAMHYDEDQVTNLIRFAERDEEEAEMHKTFVDGLVAAYQQITGEIYKPKGYVHKKMQSKNKVAPSQAAQWLAERQKKAS
tara:strand:+ start:172 stop:666 length:495 start_codon:yes stop_codon:yes gene_type:complete